MKILFISHTFPPTVGGVETQNYELSVWLPKHAELKLIANRKRWMLPLFICLVPFRAVFMMRKYDALLLGSGILGNVGWLVKKMSKKPVIVVTHGLDLTWKNKFYQRLWIGKFIPSADKLIAVGNETIAAGISHGLGEEKFVFIPNGVDTEKHLTQASRQNLAEILGKSVENKKVLLTSGRLAKRKGVAWLIRNVLPKLSQDFIYVVSGNGPDKENILEAIEEAKMQEKVYMLGYVSDQTRDILLATADLFVQPNIKIAGDMEGFGISVIEAGACRLPVLASELEGLKDAIKDGKNGFLVESENPDAYVSKINELFQNGSPRNIYGDSVRQYVVENYSWDKIARIYFEEIQKLTQKN